MPGLASRLVLLAGLLLASLPAAAQRLVVGNTAASPMAQSHAVGLQFTPGADTAAFSFSLYSSENVRVVGVSGSVANGSVQCTPLSLAFTSMRCVALATSPSADLGTGSFTVLYDIGPLTGVFPFTTYFVAYDQAGNEEDGEVQSGEITVSGPPVALTLVSAGYSHSCGLLAGGAALCWGSNFNGELGNGTTSSGNGAIPFAGRVTGLSSGVTSLSSARSHTCALASGGVKCWGWNLNGKLGDGGTANQPSPVQVVGLTSGVTALDGSSDHNCAVQAGALKCWGWNGYGQLGNNSTASSSSPVAVSGLASGVGSAATGNFHTCALTTGGAVKCWGDNFYGELGIGNTTQQLVPASVTGLASGVQAIAAGRYHSCALTSGGAVKCWGFNGRGELGNNSNTQSTVPVDVSGLSSGVTAIAAGEQHVCAIVAGGLKCWGANDNGQLGNGGTTDSKVPVSVSGLGSGVVAVSAGAFHTCARTSSGATKCWGWNYYGQLGNNGGLYGANVLLPVDVSGLSVGQPSLSIADASVVEGHAGQSNLVFTATLSSASTVATSFSPVVTPGTATAGQDYDPYSTQGQVIAAGATSVSFSVPVTGDAAIEPDETLFVTLAGVSGANVADGKATGTIIDDDDRSCRLVDDAEAGTALWQAGGSGAGANFALVTSAANSPTHSWFVPDPTQVSDRQLVLANPIVLAANTSPVIEFVHQYSLENTFDGGVLEYSTNGGGTWQDILAGSAEGVPANALRFLAGGYNTVISTSHSNPIGGRQAWTGSTAGFIASRVDLTDFAGRSLLLRFRFGSDSSQAGSGWWIDDIRIASNSGCIGPSLSIADVSVTEGNSGTKTATFTVSLGQATSMPVVFDIATADGTATAGSDYVALALSGQVIPAGQTSKAFSILILGDGVVEHDETFAVNLANVAGAGLVRGVGIGTISNDDSPRLTVTGSRSDEYSSGAGAWLGFTVSLDQPSVVPVVFDLDTIDGTAVAGSDYVALHRQGWTIYPGQTSANFQVPIVGDSVSEEDESLTVHVSNVSNAIVANAVATGTIIDDDTPRLTIADVYVNEGNAGTSTATFTASVALAGLMTSPITFNLATSNGTASAGEDYQPLNLAGQSIALGESSKTFSVTLQGDATVESHETFTLVASQVSGARAVKGTATGTIVNDDAASLSIADVSVTEGDSGTRVANFTVSQSAPSSTPVSFDIATANGTATAGSDYVALSLVGQSIPAGQTSKSFPVTINGDATVEPDETFAVNLGNLASGQSPRNAQLAVGANHACAVSDSGALRCWGANYSGQIGNGSLGGTVLTPVMVRAGGVAQVSVGAQHTCAVLATGALQCWGGNEYGQVGNGSHSNYEAVTEPVTVLASGVAQVSAGANHTCAVLVSGELRCWGYNYYGQLGNGSQYQYVVGTPVTVIASGVEQVSAGPSHTCARLASGALQCWGNNSSGQVGNGETFGNNVLLPLTVLAGGVAQVSAGGSHTCATSASGSLHCWGANFNGAVGDGSSNSYVPLPTTIIASGVLRVSAGSSHSCALVADALRCWGQNFSGQIGNGGSSGTVPVPFTVMASGVTTLWEGAGETSCVLRSIGATQCWGANHYGQVGNGATAAVPSPFSTMGGEFSIARATATGTILNDDSTALSIADVIVTEGSGGTSQALVTVSLSQPSSQPVGFNIATTDGTALAGADYTGLNLSGQSIPAGQTSISVAISIVGDALAEPDETFLVNLSNASGASIADGSAVVTIDDDDTWTLSVADAQVSEGNAGAKAMVFTISLDKPAPASGISFDVKTQDVRGSGNAARADVDYAAIAPTRRSIASGQSSATITVKVFGDTTRESDEVFSLQLSNASGAVLGQASATGTIANDDGNRLLSIGAVQGIGSTSPWLGQAVQVGGIVTARRRDGFFLQSPDGQGDGDPASSEALFVATASLPGTAIAIGQEIEVAGTVFEAADEHDSSRTRTQVAATGLRLIAENRPLPQATLLDGHWLDPRQSATMLERLEGMRVATAGVDVVAPVGGEIDHVHATAMSDGLFHVVLAGVRRPFREPGAPPGKLPSTVAGSFDGNPERLRVNSRDALGAIAWSVDAGQGIARLQGVLDERDGAHELLLDPSVMPAIRGGATPRAARPAEAGTVGIAMFPLGALYDGKDDPLRDEPVPTRDAHALRLAKLANAVCSYLRSPEIVVVSGIENQAALDELAVAVNSSAGNVLFPDGCASARDYRASLVASVPGALASGWLLDQSEVRPGVQRVQVLARQTLQPQAMFRHRDGSFEVLHETVPQLLQVRIHEADGRHLDLGLVSAALTAAPDDDGHVGQHGWATLAEQARARRLAQVQDIKAWLEQRQQQHPGEALVLLGDFDALDFNDGKEDPLASLATRPGKAPAGDMLSNLLVKLPAGERYTSVREGDAQAREHVYVNRVLLESGLQLHLEPVRLNADFGADNYGDYAVPVRTGERDPLLLRISRP